jgi:hypothetical protein
MYIVEPPSVTAIKAEAPPKFKETEKDDRPVVERVVMSGSNLSIQEHALWSSERDTILESNEKPFSGHPKKALKEFRALKSGIRTSPQSSKDSAKMIKHAKYFSSIARFITEAEDQESLCCSPWPGMAATYTRHVRGTGWKVALSLLVDWINLQCIRLHSHKLQNVDKGIVGVKAKIKHARAVAAALARTHNEAREVLLQYSSAHQLS